MTADDRNHMKREQREKRSELGARTETADQQRQVQKRKRNSAPEGGRLERAGDRRNRELAGVIRRLFCVRTGGPVVVDGGH